VKRVYNPDHLIAVYNIDHLIEDRRENGSFWVPVYTAVIGSVTISAFMGVPTLIFYLNKF
jgi:hypothetical protein